MSKEPAAAAMQRLLWVYASATGILIEGIKGYKPEVKASKSDKRLQSYGHLKFCRFSYSFSLGYKRCRHLLNAAQPPTRENFDIPDQ